MIKDQRKSDEEPAGGNYAGTYVKRYSSFIKGSKSGNTRLREEWSNGGERDINDDGSADDEEDEDTCQATISIRLFMQLFQSEGI